MHARVCVDAAAGEARLGSQAYPFALDAATGGVSLSVGGRPRFVRPLSWREKAVLARFADAGADFVEREMVRLCCAQAPSDDDGSAVLVALTAWVNGSGEDVLPLQPAILAAATMDLCRALGCRPQDLNDLDARHAEELWSAVAEADRGGAHPPAPALPEGTTRIVIVPDPDEPSVAARRPPAQPHASILSPAVRTPSFPAADATQQPIAAVEHAPEASPAVAVRQATRTPRVPHRAPDLVPDRLPDLVPRPHAVPGDGGGHPAPQQTRGNDAPAVTPAERAPGLAEPPREQARPRRNAAAAVQAGGPRRARIAFGLPQDLPQPVVWETAGASTRPAEPAKVAEAPPLAAVQSPLAPVAAPAPPAPAPTREPASTSTPAPTPAPPCGHAPHAPDSIDVICDELAERLEEAVERHGVAVR